MKKFCVLLVTCLLCLVMLSIGGSAKAVETISFLMKTGGGGAALGGGVELFNKKFEGKYKVEMVMLPLEQMQEKQVIQYITNTPTFDVFGINPATESVNFPNLTNLGPNLKEAGIDMSQFGMLVDQCTYQGQVVALPVRVGVEIVYYRKDWLEDAGLEVPDNWWTYREVARKLSKDVDGDGKIDIYGDFIKMKDRWRSYAVLKHFVLENGLGGTVLNASVSGAKVENPAPSPWLLSEYFINGLKFMESFWKEGISPDPVAQNFEENIWAIQQGKVAMSNMHSARVLFIEDPEKSKAAGKMGYTILPTQQLGPKPYVKDIGCWKLGIPNNSQNKELAFNFISFMASYEAQKYMALNYKNGPTLLRVLDDPDFLALDPSLPTLRKAYNLPLASEMPTEVKETEQVQQICHEELQKFALGIQSAEETARNMYDRLDNELTLTPAW